MTQNDASHTYINTYIIHTYIHDAQILVILRATNYEDDSWHTYDTHTNMNTYIHIMLTSRCFCMEQKFGTMVSYCTVIERTRIHTYARTCIHYAKVEMILHGTDGYEHEELQVMIIDKTFVLATASGAQMPVRVVYVCVNVFVRVSMYICLYASAFDLMHISMYRYTYVRTYTCIRMPICMYACMYVYIYMHTHTHMYYTHRYIHTC